MIAVLRQIEATQPAGVKQLGQALLIVIITLVVVQLLALSGFWR